MAAGHPLSVPRACAVFVIPLGCHCTVQRCLQGHHPSWKPDLSRASLQPGACWPSALTPADIRGTLSLSRECLLLCTRGNDPALLLALEFSLGRAQCPAEPAGRSSLHCLTSHIPLSHNSPRKDMEGMFLPWQREETFPALRPSVFCHLLSHI